MTDPNLLQALGVPVPFAAGDIAAMVDELMSQIVTAATELAVALPARHIGGSGLIPVDCEQVTVSLIQTNTGAVEAAGRNGGTGTYPNAGASMTVYQMTMTCTISRKAHEVPQQPLGANPPAPSTWAADLKSVSADLAVLARAVDLFAAVRISPVQRTFTGGPPRGGYITTSGRVVTDTV